MKNDRTVVRVAIDIPGHDAAWMVVRPVDNNDLILDELEKACRHIGSLIQRDAVANYGALAQIVNPKEEQ